MKRDKHNASAWAFLGDLDAERGKDKAAIESWKKAALASPEIARSVYPKIAAGLSARSKGADYEAFLQSILESRPDEPGARVALARALATRGERRAACELLARALEKTPQALSLHVELGRQLLADQQEGEAQKAYAGLLDQLADAERDDGLGLRKDSES